MNLEASKIRLRTLRIEDLEIIHSWRDDTELRFLTMMHPFPITLEQDREWLMDRLSDSTNKSLVYGIEQNDRNLLVGYVQLKQIDLLHKHAFLGVLIGAFDNRKKGLGTEAIFLILKYGFSFIGLNKISLHVLKENSNAIKLYERLGFIEEGTFIKQFYFDGRFHDVLRMAIFNDNGVIRRGLIK